MGMPNAVEACKLDLFAKRADLVNKYPPTLVDKIIRVRDAYTYFLSNPDAKDRELVSELINRYGIEKTAAYSDLAIVKQLLPMVGQASREFHRWRFNEMILETYQRAKKRGDQKTMEKAARSYAKFNRVDLEDERKLPYDEIVIQPFMATDDPSVLGIKPIPDLQAKIDAMLEKYAGETSDIEDVEYEEYDLEEDELWGEEAEEDERII